MSETGSGPEKTRRSLVERSAEDEQLRQRLLENPKATIEQELGAGLPEEIEVRVVEETPETIYLVLPPMTSPHREGDELSERELDAVAGGYGTADICALHSCQFDPTVIRCDQ